MERLSSPGLSQGTFHSPRLLKRQLSRCPAELEVDATTGVGEKPRKRRNHGRKKKSGDGQLVEIGIQS